MKAAFIAWILRAPGLYNYSKAQLLEDMMDTDQYAGVAYAAWKAAWRAKP